MKEENIKGEYQRKVDKSLIPTCNIMGVNIAAINMNWLLKYLDENLSDIKGDGSCLFCREYYYVYPFWNLSTDGI